jgi:hypothetical protein
MLPQTGSTVRGLDRDMDIQYVLAVRLHLSETILVHQIAMSPPSKLQYWRDRSCNSPRKCSIGGPGARSESFYSSRCFCQDENDGGHC